MFKSDRDAKSVFECFRGTLIHDAHGKIIEKSERWGINQDVFRYRYDGGGRLTHVFKGGQLVEFYAYNGEG